MAEKTKNLGLRATEERWRDLNQLALDRGTSVQRLFDEAMQRMYFDGKGPEKKTTPDPEPIELQQTRKILESGDELAINAVRMTLRLCMGNVRAPKKKAV